MRKLIDVSSRYGAPMGRWNILATDPMLAHKMHLVRLRWVDGDYDAGGAYWGRSSLSGDNIYWAYGEDEEIQFEHFVRARSRDEAKAQIRQVYPSAKFYR